jgi:hypothetical protein
VRGGSEPCTTQFGTTSCLPVAISSRASVGGRAQRSESSHSTQSSSPSATPSSQFRTCVSGIFCQLSGAILSVEPLPHLRQALPPRQLHAHRMPLLATRHRRIHPAADAACDAASLPVATTRGAEVLLEGTE